MPILGKIEEHGCGLGKAFAYHFNKKEIVIMQLRHVHNNASDGSSTVLVFPRTALPWCYKRVRDFPVCILSNSGQSGPEKCERLSDKAAPLATTMQGIDPLTVTASTQGGTGGVEPGVITSDSIVLNNASATCFDPTFCEVNLSAIETSDHDRDTSDVFQATPESDKNVVILRLGANGRYHTVFGRDRINENRSLGKEAIGAWVTRWTDDQMARCRDVRKGSLKLLPVDLGELVDELFPKGCEASKTYWYGVIADLLGISLSTARIYHRAYQVFRAGQSGLVPELRESSSLKERPYHLAAMYEWIGNESLPALVTKCVNEKWSLKDTKSIVNTAFSE